MKRAIFMPNWVGDALMATPALRALRSTFPGDEAVAILQPYVAEVLAGTGLVDRLILRSKTSKRLSEHSPPVFSGWSLISQLRKERFDEAILFPNSLHSAWLGWAGGARKRIGLNRDGRGLLLTQRIPSSNKKIPHPAMEDYLQIVEAAGAMVPLPRQARMELALTEPGQFAWKGFLAKEAAISAAPGIVAFNTGGAFGAAKDWPTESFVELARKIINSTEYAVVVLCGPAEKEKSIEIESRVNDLRVRSLGRESLSLSLTKSAIAGSRMLITTDSGPRHFAAALNVPHVVLFGPTHQAWSETWSPLSTSIQLAMLCGPCQKRVCPLGHHDCMRLLKVDLVWREIQRQLSQRKAA
ncbi:lipopolysaccharide heptosyltransferase II [Planctopirus limnophila DSM 3776]|uniref:lipopolysaccharide heptosyltransferase II n=1 Tax=Planctopirus limnophila (strain ATCC 43296 / DSM 3776 / IFAM 1008 / Mu 290) TaxID=521674 RepID=D5SSJ5_PLAL2|nr:lipopolysaccharide heptosyltransferase II [Planctopirus limnophila]ADG66743.1 lipopolysaccharide heptosyltransferase II [Planctopirus limnophila DSM 3776]